MSYKNTSDSTTVNNSVKGVFFMLRSMIILLMTASPLFAAESLWPPITREARPWAYHWWMGSAVDEANLAWNFKQFQDAGLGGVHIVPIYGVKGYEDRYIPFMSPQWVEMMQCAVKEADKRDMGVDMSLGTGWPFGGAAVSQADGSMVFSLVEKDGKFEIATKPGGMVVKRAAPGGAGLILNSYSVGAMSNYLAWFEERFEGRKTPFPRAFYHDSYEYYTQNWSDDLLEVFAARRGYRLEDELTALAGRGDEDRIRRVKADYRKTVEEMHLDYIRLWVKWCQKHGAVTRNQAHGSPSNLLDTYAAADIPETEFFFKDRYPLSAKFSSSAAHVSGRNLVAAETGTWLDEHFHEKLGDLKMMFDTLFVSGINHIFYHGTTFSPQDAPWPGWLFYASTQMNPRNSIWRDAKYLNEYTARCQSVLQAGRPGNDILLYWPINDLWHNKDGMQIHLEVAHNPRWLRDQPIGELASFLWKNGYQFDYISDAQLLESKNAGTDIATQSGNRYRVILVPRCRYLPLETAQKLTALAKGGARVLFDGDVPSDVPGLHNFEQRRQTLKTVLEEGGFHSSITQDRQGTLANIGVRPETIVPQTGIKLIRREIETGTFYFLSNTNDAMEPSETLEPVDGWFTLGKFEANGVVLMDPMTGKTGKALRRVNPDTKEREFYLQLKPNGSMIVQICSDQLHPEGLSDWQYGKPSDEAPLALKAGWSVEFIEGGPELPAARTLDTLSSWTEWNDPLCVKFAGTARYSTTFDLPSSPGDKAFQLDLGQVCESVRVRINGVDLGCLFIYPYTIDLPRKELKTTGNVLELEVTNLSANRIRDMDINKVPWKIFHDANIVGTDYRPLDASKWPLVPSGLIGPVRIMNDE